MREVIAAEVAADQEKYSEAFLGRSGRHRICLIITKIFVQSNISIWQGEQVVLRVDPREGRLGRRHRGADPRRVLPGGDSRRRHCLRYLRVSHFT